jgi:predicted RNA binding protein YcfA (HicA-like mRNA interferase family)
VKLGLPNLKLNMPKRRKFSGEQICKLLEENGFVFVRQRGSHRIMQMAVQTGTITVPVPIHKDLIIKGSVPRNVAFELMRP